MKFRGESKVQRKGVTAIPFEVRKAFGIEIGDFITWDVDTADRDDAAIVTRRRRNDDDVKGAQ